MHTPTRRDRSGCPAPRHGTAAAYTRAGCRCPDAREAIRLYTKRRRTGHPEVRRVPAVGVVRRIHALMALGHNSATIGQAAGMSQYQVQQTARRRRFVSPATFERVCRAYDQLSMTPGASAWTKVRAEAAGWPPPLAWDDGTIDDPQAVAVFGRQPAGAHVRSVEDIRERREEIRRLWRDGLNDAEIAAVTGDKPNAVKKVRHRHGWTRPQSARARAAA